MVIDFNMIFLLYQRKQIPWVMRKSPSLEHRLNPNIQSSPKNNRHRRFQGQVDFIEGACTPSKKAPRNFLSIEFIAAEAVSS